MALTDVEFVREWDLLWTTHGEIKEYVAYLSWRYYILGDLVFTLDYATSLATADYQYGRLSYYAYLRLYGWIVAKDPDTYIKDKYNIHTGTAGKFTLTTTVDPVLSGSGVTLSPAGGLYSPGTVVTLTAVPVEGYEFTSWSGDLVSTENPTTLTVDSDKFVTAHFTLVEVIQPEPEAGVDLSGLLGMVIPIIGLTVVMSVMSPMLQGEESL